MTNHLFCTFYIVRHGETEHNVKGIIQGHSNSSLTKKGVKQAKEVSQLLRGVHFDAVFSSDLDRAIQTAQLITHEKKYDIHTTSLLRERSFGKWEGKPSTIFENELKEETKRFLMLSDNQKPDFTYPDIENYTSITLRFITFLRSVSLSYADKTVLVVTHGGLMRALLIHIGFGSYSQVSRGSIENASIIQLISDGLHIKIKKTKGIQLFPT